MFNYLLFVLIVLLFIIYLIYTVKSKGLRKVILEAIIEAEDMYSSTTGQERLQIAIDYTYNLIPEFYRKIIPESYIEEFLKKLIQKIFDEIKVVLDYSKE